MSERPAQPANALAGGDRALAEQLVAYLDGELPADNRRLLEDRLASDPQAQHELQLLDRSWQLLDSLPAAPVDDRFTRSTVEMVAQSVLAEQQSAQRWAPWRRFGTWLLGLTLVATCAGIGYAAVAANADDENAHLLAELPVLENLEAYRQVEQIEFARMLLAIPAERFAEDRAEDNTPPGPAPADTPAPAGVSAPAPEASADPAADTTPPVVRRGETISERAARVAALSTVEKQALLRRYQRFCSFEPERQTELRALAAAIEQDEAAVELLAACTRYYAWVLTLSSLDRDELRQLAPADRLAEIERRLAESDARRQQRRRNDWEGPRRENITVIGQWLRDEVLPAWRAEVLDSLPAERRAELEKLEPRQREQAIMAAGYRLMRERGDRGPQFSAAQLDSLATRLQPPAKQLLAEAPTPEARQALVGRWLSEMRDGFGSGGPGRSRGYEGRHRELQQFYAEELSPEERKALEALPRDQFWRRLWELYAEDRFIRGEPVPEYRSPRSDSDRRGRGPGGPPRSTP